MKAKVTGVSAWQGTPTGGTLDIRVPRYADSTGNATVSHYTGVLNVVLNPPRWMDAQDPTKELWIVVQGPDDPPGPRATFYEVLEYGPDKVVRTEFSRRLVSSDLQGLLFDYADTDGPLPAGFGDAPLTMRAAQQLLENGPAVVAGAAAAQEAADRANGLADALGATGLLYLGADGSAAVLGVTSVATLSTVNEVVPLAGLLAVPHLEVP